MKDYLEKNLNDAPMLGAFVNQSEKIKVEGFELIKVEERDGKQAINARGLHQFLGIGKDFSSWIKKQIERCDLVENQDFGGCVISLWRTLFYVIYCIILEVS